MGVSSLGVSQVYVVVVDLITPYPLPTSCITLLPPLYHFPPVIANSHLPPNIYILSPHHYPRYLTSSSFSIPPPLPPSPSLSPSLPPSLPPSLSRSIALALSTPVLSLKPSLRHSLPIPFLPPSLLPSHRSFLPPSSYSLPPSLALLPSAVKIILIFIIK